MKDIKRNTEHTSFFLLILRRIIEESLNELMVLRNECEIHDLLKYRFMSYGIPTQTRITLTSDEFPSLEIDLLCENKIAIEVKLDANFYDGFAQALSMREFYGLNALVIHIFRKPINSKIIRGISKLSKLLNIPAIIVDIKNGKIVM